MKKFSAIFLVTMIFGLGVAKGSNDSTRTITIHFLYGSQPGPGQKGKEQPAFGGIHGGHVLLQLNDSEIFSFYPSGEGFHLFADNVHKHGEYILEPLNDWAGDTATKKYTSITFPITDSQYVQLMKIKQVYLAQRPYDYAFFGMRCAAAAYDVLSQLRICKPYSGFHNVMANFYPKPLRQRLLKYATQHHLKVTGHSGRSTRIWERDGL